MKKTLKIAEKGDKLIYMNKKRKTARALALGGGIVVMLPLLAPFLLGAIVSVSRGRFLFDWLMPGELFFVELAGAVLLLIAAAVGGQMRAWIIAAAATAVAALPLMQLLATLTGLAHGDTEPGGWQWTLVLSVYALYILALIALAVGGFFLYRRLGRDY